MRLKSLSLTNFGPFGEKQKVDFTRYESNDHVLIIGDNKDTAGADSNGSGKTQMFNALSWLLLDHTPNGRPTDEVIREGTDFTKVAGIFDDRDGNELFIQKSRNRGNSSEAIFKIGEEDFTKRTYSQTQMAILNHFGILENNKDYYNDFLNTTYFSIDALKAFAGKKSSSKDRMDLINRFLRGEVLDRATSYCKTKISNLEGEKSISEGQLEQIQERLQSDNDENTLKGQISQDRSDIIEFEADIDSLKNKLTSIIEREEVITNIEDVEALIKQTESQFEDYKEQIEESIEDLKNQKHKKSKISEKIKELEEKIDDKEEQKLKDNKYKLGEIIKKGYKKLNTLNSKENSLSDQLEKEINCPDCGASLMIKDDELLPLDKTEIKKSIKKLSKEIKEVETKIEELEDKNKILEEEISNINKVSIELKNLKSREKELSNIPKKIEEKEERLSAQEEKNQERVKKLKSKKTQLEFKLKKLPEVDISLRGDIESSIDVKDKKIKEKRDNISRNEYIIDSIKKDQKKEKEIKSEIEKLSKQIEKYNFWKNGFPEIKRWMINSFLPSFEEQTNHFLSKLEVGLRVYFDTLKAKKSKKGEFREAFDISIMDENNYKRDFETFSQGESKRIGICTGFALRELTLNKGYNAFDFLLIDEIVDSLDETGINEFFSLLNEISGLKLIISHDSSLKNRFSNVINFIKEDGITTVKQT